MRKPFFFNRKQILLFFGLICLWGSASIVFLYIKRTPNSTQELPVRKDFVEEIPNTVLDAASGDANSVEQTMEISRFNEEADTTPGRKRPYHISKHHKGNHIITSKTPKWISFENYCKQQQHVIVDKVEPVAFDFRNPDFTNTPVSNNRPVFTYAMANITEALVQPTVTVIVPFFNVEHIFYGTMKSIMQQSLQQIEVVIVNDASTNAVSLKILDEFRDGKYDPRVRVVDHTTNLGPGAARNTGAKEARAEYIYFLDGDDLLEPTSLEKLYFHLISAPQFAFTKGYSLGYGAFNYLWPYGFEQREKFLKENSVTVHTMMTKTHMERIGGFESGLRRGLEDWEFWLKSAENGYWGSTIKEYMDWYLRKTKDQTKQAWHDWDKTADDLKYSQKFPRIYQGQFPNPVRTLKSFDVSLTVPQEAKNFLKKTKPRLMIVIPWCVLGGADKFNINLMRQLYFRDWEITIVTTLDSDNKWVPDFLKWTPDVFLMPNFLDMNHFPRFLIYLIKSRRPDVVMISNSEFGYQILPSLRAAVPEPAYIDYTHMEQEEWKNGGYPRYSVGSAGMLDLNIVASNFLKDWMISRGGDDQRIRVCYVNVDAEEFKRDVPARERIREKHGIPQNATVIIYAARFVAQKQPKVMANVFKQLLDKGLDFYAIVAGDGSDKAWVEDFVRQNKLESRILLVGSINVDQITSYMSASDIIFLPSEWEGIALAIYEGMSMSLAVVGANVGGQKELFKGRSENDFGYLIPKYNDPKQTIEKYISIFEELLPNKALVEKMGRNARDQILKFFDMDLMGDCMIKQFCYANQLRQSRPKFEFSLEAAQEFANRGVEFMKMQEGK